MSLGGTSSQLVKLEGQTSDLLKNLEDLGRTKNGEEQLRQILALRRERTNSKWDLAPRQYWTTK